jgi:four helix bundle protein
MATIYRFEDLEIWQPARKLYQKVSKLAEKLKKNHDYHFAEQMKAAIGSVMDNVAEGFERNSLEFLNSLSIAKGECGELRSQFYRCLDDKYLTQKEFDDYYEEADKVSKKIATFVKYLNNSKIRGLKFKGWLNNDKRST